MTISSMIHNRKGSAGSNRSWKVKALYSDPDSIGWQIYELTHYGVEMLVWRESGKLIEFLHVGTGHGTVSDQQGMNIAFKVLAPNMYFSRKGGAHIIDQER